jgi:FtsP/CotA-like multicopper oxidase with cupredoxin domain
MKAVLFAIAAPLLAGVGVVEALTAADEADEHEERKRSGAGGVANTAGALVDEESGWPIEEAQLAYAPCVPPPPRRTHSVVLRTTFTTQYAPLPLDDVHQFGFWAFNGHVPGPMIRAREGDILEITHRNEDLCGLQHNIDFHAAVGPGGGAALLTADRGEARTARLALARPGLFVYHCAVDPIVQHISNGMHGLVLVEPKDSNAALPPVEREFYVVQHEVYALEAEGPSPLREFSIQVRFASSVARLVVVSSLPKD